MGPFPPSFGNLYILLVVDYVSKLVKAIACPRNDDNTVVGFIVTPRFPIRPDWRIRTEFGV